MAIEVAQRSCGGGGGGGNPLGGGHAAKSHGEEIVAMIYFILLVNLLSILLPFFFPSPTQLALSVVDEQCHCSFSLFSSSSRFIAASKSHVALLVESICSTSGDVFPPSVSRYRSVCLPRKGRYLCRSIARSAREPIQDTMTTSAPPRVVGLQSSSSSPPKSTASDVNQGRR